MILGTNLTDIKKDGDFSSKQATIDPRKLAKLQHMLTKGLYSDPITATIAEWANNGIDSVISSGKDPIEYPVEVRLTENSFSVEDKGLGISKQEFEEVCMSYLSSTKEQDPTALGCYGIGMKSFLSLGKSATFTIRKDGIEAKYIAYEGSEFMEYDLIYEKPTTEGNGAKAEIPIKDWNEFNQFRNKAIQKLAYYDTVALYIEDNFYENEIIRSEDWQYSSNNSSNSMHLCLKDVYYTIDFSKLGIMNINLPVALRFGLDSGLTPTPSRESIIMNEATIKIIKEKIVKVADWFVEKYNSEWKEEDSIITAWNKIGVSDKKITVGGKEFIINSLLKHSNITTKELKIKGIELKTPEYYKGVVDFDEYERLAVSEYYGWKVKRIYTTIKESLLQNSWKVIEVEHVPTGRVKKYLLEKHKGKKLLFIRKESTRKLGSRKADLRNNIDYRYLLKLATHQKIDWRKLIVEYQEFVEKPFKNLIIDEKGVENSTEYQTWLTNYKEELKANRGSGNSVSNYERLNKKEGQITLHYCVKSDCRSGYTVKKKAVDVAKIANNKNVVIYFPIEEKETALKVKRLLKENYGVVLIGIREINRVKEFTNFINMEELSKSQIFKRIASAELFRPELEAFDRLYKNKGLESMITECLESFRKDVTILREYVNKWGKDIDDNELLQSILEIAAEKHLYDYSLFTEYLNVKKNLQKYDFLNLIKTPDYWRNSEEVLKYKALINKLLYLKIKSGEITDFEIVPIVKEVVSVPEEVVELEVA